MDVDFSDATSNASSTVLDLVEADDLDEINVADTEDVEDLTAAAPGVSKDNGAEEVLQDAGVEELKRGGISVKPRPYQLEMLEESLKKNIIVAMDTGSGKTHVAVLRIAHELERLQSDQLVWFLAPTVSLCAQQFAYLQSQITAVQMKYLSGADGVDRWTDQKLWDLVLANVKVVVSTYQILLDALTHGFIEMERLALIVFDEVHNCVAKHPGAKVMHNFYHPRKTAGLNVPHILGLTASPLMRSNPSSLHKIEETLDAICRTPTRHRSELRNHVKLPSFLQVYFSSIADSGIPEYTRLITSLEATMKSLKLQEDPYVLALKEENSERSMRALNKVYLNHKTWTRDQLLTFYGASTRMYNELGAWAVGFYITKVIDNAVKLGEGDFSNDLIGLLDSSQSEKQYLARNLKMVKNTINEVDTDVSMISDKVDKLIQTLVKLSAGFRGIVFVEERTTAEVLAILLRTHPCTRELFNIGTMVGTSTNTNRTKNIADIVDIEVQKHVLDKFRNGEINLVVATNVLEEGIDVPACNAVVCFQKPANLKSFVQRRGRARQKESKLILFLDVVDDTRKLVEFQRLEEMMKQIYQDEMRALTEYLALEDSEEGDHRQFQVESTGALLDLDNAVSHLHHFCATLPAEDYVDLRPEFICTSEGSKVRAKVILPLSVDLSVREAESLTEWDSEKNAIKDVSFQAYVALYHAGLVNENLLPLMRFDEEAEDLLASTIEKRVSLIEVHEQCNPWIAVAQAWTRNQEPRLYLMKVGSQVMQVSLPHDLPAIAPFDLYWDPSTIVPVSLSTCKRQVLVMEDLERQRADTYNITCAAYARRFPVYNQLQVLLFSPYEEVKLTNLPTIIANNHLGAENFNPLTAGLVRDSLEKHVAYVYQDFLTTKPAIHMVQNPYIGYTEIHQEEAHLVVKKVPKRADFIHRIVAGSSPASERYSAVLPVSRCELDETPFSYVRFALLLPSIQHRLSIYLLAQQLSSTVLKAVEMSNIELIVTAISCSSAQEPTNYQRFEFLGDSILKLCTSIQLMALYPIWHEGLLSFKKDRFVSNQRLARASIEAGLDKFIVTKAFTGNRWRPLYVHELVERDELDPKRQLSSKTVADVVESLIGAATLDGGIPKALSCLAVLLPEMDWQDLATRQYFLFQRTQDLPLPAILAPLETLLGYTFKKKALLLEALTHASYVSSTSGSLERLEFLGDAILDGIVVTEMWNHNLTHVQMHTLRSAIVNADFLAWTCLENSVEQATASVTSSLEVKAGSERLQLWRFLRHSSYSLSKAQHETARRHLLLRDEINTAIQSGTSYPWALCARLDAMKFFSDMIESLLGAIWIDSHDPTLPPAAPSPSGGLAHDPIFDTCKQVLETLGVMKYMRRILRDGVHALHPKEELGMLADEKKVKYVLENRRFKSVGNEEGIFGASFQQNGHDGVLVEGMMEYICTIYVGEEEVVKVTGGISKVEAKTRAATEAVRVLRLQELNQGKEKMEHIQKEAVETRSTALEGIKAVGSDDGHDMAVDD